MTSPMRVYAPNKAMHYAVGRDVMKELREWWSDPEVRAIAWRHFHPAIYQPLQKFAAGGMRSINLHVR